eukprot:1783194-Prorocentrum_lima.AAC.1
MCIRDSDDDEWSNPVLMRPSVKREDPPHVGMTARLTAAGTPGSGYGYEHSWKQLKELPTLSIQVNLGRGITRA